jgi:hypothetical protein
MQQVADRIAGYPTSCRESDPVMSLRSVRVVASFAGQTGDQTGMGSELSHLDNAALVREHERSLKGLTSLDPDVPDWVREIRVMYHNYVLRELLTRSAAALALQTRHLQR